MYTLFYIELLFVFAFIINLCHFHAGTRQRMMIMKFGVGVIYAFYFYMLGYETAMLAALISGFGGLAQACFKEQALHKTKLLRTGVAVILAGLSIVFSAGNTMDALPLVAVINSRLMEVQSSQQRIRVGYIFSMLCWITYAVSSGLILVYITENLNMMSNLYAIWKEEQKRKKAVTVKTAPAHAA